MKINTKINFFLKDKLQIKHKYSTNSIRFPSEQLASPIRLGIQIKRELIFARHKSFARYLIFRNQFSTLPIEKANPPKQAIKDKLVDMSVQFNQNLIYDDQRIITGQTPKNMKTQSAFSDSLTCQFLTDRRLLSSTQDESQEKSESQKQEQQEQTQEEYYTVFNSTFTSLLKRFVYGNNNIQEKMKEIENEINLNKQAKQIAGDGVLQFKGVLLKQQNLDFSSFSDSSSNLQELLLFGKVAFNLDELIVKEIPLNTYQLTKFVTQLLKTLAVLQFNGMTHGNLSLYSIYYAPKGWVISDFSKARYFQNESNEMNEIIKNDMYQLGLVILQVGIQTKFDEDDKEQLPFFLKQFKKKSSDLNRILEGLLFPASEDNNLRYQDLIDNNLEDHTFENEYQDTHFTLKSQLTCSNQNFFSPRANHFNRKINTEQSDRSKSRCPSQQPNNKSVEKEPQNKLQKTELNPKRINKTPVMHGSILTINEITPPHKKEQMSSKQQAELFQSQSEELTFGEDSSAISNPDKKVFAKSQRTGEQQRLVFVKQNNNIVHKAFPRQLGNNSRANEANNGVQPQSEEMKEEPRLESQSSTPNVSQQFTKRKQQLQPQMPIQNAFQQINNNGLTIPQRNQLNQVPDNIFMATVNGKQKPINVQPPKVNPVQQMEGAENQEDFYDQKSGPLSDDSYFNLMLNENLSSHRLRKLQQQINIIQKVTLPQLNNLLLIPESQNRTCQVNSQLYFIKVSQPFLNYQALSILHSLDQFAEMKNKSNGSSDHLIVPQLFRLSKIDDGRCRLWIFTIYQKEAKCLSVKSLEDFTFQQKIEIAEQLTKQLLDIKKYSKEINLIHGSLKPSNILLINKNIFLLDFGCFNFLTNQQKAMNYPSNSNISYATKNPYSAPEVIETQHASFESDVWSLGLIFYLIFWEQDIDQEKIKTFKLHDHNLKSGCLDLGNLENDALYNIFSLLIKMMTQNFPQNRLNLQDVQAQLGYAKSKMNEDKNGNQNQPIEMTNKKFPQIFPVVHPTSTLSRNPSQTNIRAQVSRQSLLSNQQQQKKISSNNPPAQQIESNRPIRTPQQN